jgi:hypothetical protein
MSEWIDVKQELPPFKKTKADVISGTPGVEVLIWPRESCVTAFYGTRCGLGPTFYMYGARITGVTHWMPLPSAPADSK